MAGAGPTLAPTTRSEEQLRRIVGGGSGSWGERRTAYQNAADSDGDGLGRWRRDRAAVLREPIERVADVRGMCGEEGDEATDQADALHDELALRHLW